METKSGNELRRDMYYGNPLRLDLEVMRARAFKLSTEKDRQGQYTHVVIHHHDFNTPCITTAQAYYHEDFPAGPPKER